METSQDQIKRQCSLSKCLRSSTTLNQVVNIVSFRWTRTIIIMMMMMMMIMMMMMMMMMIIIIIIIRILKPVLLIIPREPRSTVYYSKQMVS